MKKSSFTAMILGTVSMVLFALGMCMTLLPQWDAFLPGVAAGCAGLILGLVTVIVWRKMEHKAPVSITGKGILTMLTAAAGTLALGVGMCFCMVWGNMIPGILIGLAGMILLLTLIPMTRGLK